VVSDPSVAVRVSHLPLGHKLSWQNRRKQLSSTRITSNGDGRMMREESSVHPISKLSDFKFW
jgi:hypothetical protein